MPEQTAQTPPLPDTSEDSSSEWYNKQSDKPSEEEWVHPKYAHYERMESISHQIEAWEERASEIHSRPEEQPVPLEDGSGSYYESLTFYHGSVRSGIEVMDSAEENSLVTGFYGTHKPDGAAEYGAKRFLEGTRGLERFKDLTAEDMEPVIYEVNATDVKIVDLKTKGALHDALVRFNNEIPAIRESLPEQTIWEALASRLESTLGDPQSSMRDMVNAAGPFREYFTAMLAQEGYSGAVYPELSEVDFSPIDSLIIFDPSKLQITGQELLDVA